MTHGAEAPARIVIVGGGHVGMNAARSLRASLRGDEATVTVIDPRSYMTYQPFLAEAAAGSVEPRHVVVPLREALPGCEVLSGEVIGARPDERTVSVLVADGHTRHIGYDVLVLAPGSWSKTLPIPGLAEHAVGFKTLAEAIYLRNHVLSRLDAAASTLDPKLREKLLTFVFVGGGYAGVEALAELANMASAASDYYETIRPSDMRWVLVEAASRIMPEVSEGLGQYTLDFLRDEGFETHLNTTLESIEDGYVKLSDGTGFDADTVVWTAGVAPHPMLANTGFPLDDKGRVRCDADLRVDGQDVVFAAGDCAAVPDLSRSPTRTCPPSAQHASRQAKRLAKNIVSLLRGDAPRRYKHAYAGSVASLGLYRGVAEIYGVKLKGPLAWALHRGYHLATMPTAHRKVRISFDWLLSLPFRRQIVALGELHHPRREFDRASAGPRNEPPASSAESDPRVK
ncbi:NAD(P)/FAD-dependent oxidoreductase [Haloechinothrix salitolerans]|uniref:NAD(P)/FAD-dependent oxidoreductase n=1 Tax=Haloechinothrix salitolerans TaxID=926830 RepID=A0ABW2C1D3_9PSEU